MEIEALRLKVENQQNVINELTAENEQLFQQFNHLMVRNGKLLKRIDDMQQIIDSMHLRIEESQLIHDNMLKINDGLRAQHDPSSRQPGTAADRDVVGAIDKLNRRIDELHLRNDVLQQRANILSGGTVATRIAENEPVNHTGVDAEKLYVLWKNYPGQHARNAPNLRKQSMMLLHLYENNSLNAESLFQKTGVNGVTGARYVAVLKQFNLIEYRGARKKGRYFITQQGTDLIERTKEENEFSADLLADVPSPKFESQRLKMAIENPDL